MGEMFALLFNDLEGKPDEKHCRNDFEGEL
jgi:hypothetical protein